MRDAFLISFYFKSNVQVNAQQGYRHLKITQDTSYLYTVPLLIDILDGLTGQRVSNFLSFNIRKTCP